MLLNQCLTVACPQCDLLMEKFQVAYGQKAFCPRCHTVLYQPVKHSIEYTLAFSVTGLILFVPANTTPVLSLHLFGLSQDTTILHGIFFLFNAELWIVAGLILICAVAAPLINLLLICYVSLSLALHTPFPFVTMAFRLYHHVLEWAMLEVYLLGILVSLVKLADKAEVIFGVGLYCFVGLLLAALFVTTHVDKDYYWQRLEQ